jgi:hypothetical protein
MQVIKPCHTGRADGNDLRDVLAALDSFLHSPGPHVRRYRTYGRTYQTCGHRHPLRHITRLADELEFGESALPHWVHISAAD